MHRSEDDVIYTWEIQNFNHMTDTFLVSPEAQLPELGYGFWQLVVYPPNEPESLPIQCGLRNIPVHDGLHDTNVLFSFELLDDDENVCGRVSPRTGHFPDDNDDSHPFFLGIRFFECGTVTIKCRIRRLEEHHFQSMSLSAVTEIVHQRVTEVVEIVDSDTVSLEWSILMAKYPEEDTEEVVQKKPIVNVSICYSPDREEYICAMQSLGTFEPFVITCCPSVLTTKGQKFPLTDLEWHYYPTAGTLHHPEMPNRRYLNNTNKDLKDAQNRFRVQFDMQFFLGQTIHRQEKRPVTRRHIPGCETTLSDGLVRHYDDEKYSDWSISFDPDEPPIHVHKCILASRSPYFRAMLETNMVEKASEQIYLPDWDFSTLEDTLRFMYTNKVVLRGYKKAAKVYRAAHMYLLPELQAACSEFLQCLVDEDNADELRDLAKRYDDADLEKAVDELVPREDSVVPEEEEEETPRRYPKRSTKRIRS